MIVKLSEKVKLNIHGEYCAFIDKYIDRLPVEHTGIYLYCVKNTVDKDIDIKDIASFLNKDEKSIISLFNYLALIDIVSVEEEAFVINGIPKETVLSPYMKKPEVSIKEIEYSKMSNPEIRSLFDEIEKKYGRMLTHKDIESIYIFYDFYKLPSDVILFLFDFCINRNKRRMSYIEKVALDWAENGINSVEKAKDHVCLFLTENEDILSILKAMGITGRFVTSFENELISKWKDDYGFDINMILLACEKKASFKYADKVLESWHKKGIKTIEAAKKESEEHAEKYHKDHEHKKSKNQFTDFSNQRKYDYTDLEKMIFKKHKSHTEDK